MADVKFVCIFPILMPFQHGGFHELRILQIYFKQNALRSYTKNIIYEMIFVLKYSF